MSNQNISYILFFMVIICFILLSFFFTNKNVGDIKLKPVPTATPSATLIPQKPTNSGTQPVVNTPILRPTEKVDQVPVEKNNPQNYQPNNQVNIQPAPQPTPEQGIINEVIQGVKKLL